MTTGIELLALARVQGGELAGTFGQGPEGDAARAAVVGALLTVRSDADAPVLRELTRLEIDSVRRTDDGCGDTLLACCWMLFLLGDVADSALIWEAKNLNFDTHCAVDSVFLVPRGIDATVEFATTHGLDDLASWAGNSIGDVEEHVTAWREAPYFDSVPQRPRPWTS